MYAYIESNYVFSLHYSLQYTAVLSLVRITDTLKSIGALSDSVTGGNGNPLE